MRKNTTSEVMERFTEKREKAKELSTARLFELHSVIPETFDIDEKLEAMSLEIISAVMNGEDADKAIGRIRKETDALREKRNRLLSENGYPSDYSDVHYDCTLCSDTGFVGMKMCSCLRKAMSAAAFEDSGISHLVMTQSFETFKLDYYTDKARALAQKNYQVLKDFAENFAESKGKSFILMGNTGLGKTHLSTSVAKVLLENGYKVSYDSASDIMADFEAERFGKDTVTAEELRRRYMDTDLLIIDDLGCEMTTQFTVTCVYNLINSRLAAGLSTLINTNLTQNELREKYADRITSRIFGEYRPLLFLGKDIRAQKLG